MSAFLLEESFPMIWLPALPLWIFVALNTRPAAGDPGLLEYA
jgi:hypothetical protein